jgi:hypothetical protein
MFDVLFCLDAKKYYIIGGVLFFGDFILGLSKDSFAQAKESK